MSQFSKYDILELLPQRRPFVMIDSLLYCDTAVTRTSLEVRDDNIFNDVNYVLNKDVLLQYIMSKGRRSYPHHRS